MNMTHWKKRPLYVSVALCFLSGAVQAQQEPATPPGPLAPVDPPAKIAAAPDAQAAGPQGLQEIVVTATRRATSLQVVPATVQAMTASMLTELNIKGTESLGTLVPGLTISRSGGVNPYLRGLGTVGSGFTGDSPIAIYIDGLYLVNAAGALFSFNNIERIEVLKGPQGTLYGRNSTGGLISIVTQDPDETPSADASIGYASYKTLTANVYGSTAITDKLFANVSFFHEKQNKGWAVNDFTGHDVGKSDETGVQAKLVWKPQAGTKITLNGIYDSNTSDKGYLLGIVPGSFGNDGTPYLGEYHISSRRDPSAVYRGYAGSLKLEQDAGFANFTSLSGYQTANQLQAFSLTGAPGNPVAGQSDSNSGIYGKNKTFTQEFQLSSKASTSPLDWIVGAFYLDDETTSIVDASPTCVGNTCAPGVPTHTSGFLGTKSYSVYGDGTYKIREGTRVTLGLRYTKDDKNISGVAEPLPGLPDSVAALPATTVLHPGDPYTGNPAGIPTSVSFSKFTYRAVLAQDLTRDVHAYLSYNRGFRSGSYQATAFNNPAARPEILDAYEAGLKTELLDRRLRLNASAFYYNYTDIQVRSNAPPAPVGTSININAAGAHVKGVGADFRFSATRELTLNGGFEYLDAKYTSFPGATCNSPRVPAGTVRGGVASVACNLAGFTLPGAPKNSFVLGAQYRVETNFGQFTLAANDNYKSSYPFSADASIKQDAHHIVNASVTWSPNERYEVQLYGKNLTDEYYYVTGRSGPLTLVYVPGAPRTLGINVRYHF